MVEICISVIDKTATDPAVDANQPKRGVVIAAFADGHVYGRMELTHPMFRILKLPGVPMAFGQAFLGEEVGDRTTNPHLLARQFKLEIDNPAIPAGLQRYIADDSRGTPSFTVDLAAWPLAAISALKTKRASVGVDIGQPTTIIG